MTNAEILARLDALGEAAKGRMAACSPDFVGVVGGAEIDFMTPDERAERHRLIFALPTMAEERAAARARIAARIAARKARRASNE